MRMLRSDLEPFMPPEFQEEPPGFLPLVTEQPVRDWALALHAMWPRLCRQVKGPSLRMHQSLCRVWLQYQ